MSSRLAITKTQQDQIDAVAEVLQPWGLTWTAEMGGKHLMVRVKGPKGGEWKITIACTPRSNGFAIDLARQKARRVVHDINNRLGLYAGR